MRLILIAFAWLPGFFLSSCMKLSHTEDCSTPSFLLHIWEFASRICRRNLPWLFTVRICRGYLPWVFCIRKRILFWICEQILFIWKQTFFTCEQNFLICEVFFVNSVSLCYYRGSYGLPQLMVYDAFKAYTTDEMKAVLSINSTSLIMVPPGCTSKCKPLDVCIKKPFKRCFT